MERLGMRNRLIQSLAVIACIFVALEASAQEANVCLRDRDVHTAKAYNSDTIIVTDRRRDQYTVNLIGICAGLSPSSLFINLHPKRGAINCLRRGDEVTYSMPGDTRVSGICLVDTIEEGAPS
jgi:hypothetical protein